MLLRVAGGFCLATSLERFLQKLHQHYAFKNILESTKEMGYSIEEEHFTSDGAIELVVGRWN